MAEETSMSEPRAQTEDQLPYSQRHDTVGGSLPAFPAQEIAHGGDMFYGLTKRELFAAMAMQGICGDGIPGRHHHWDETAKDAVAYADALLKELTK